MPCFMIRHGRLLSCDRVGFHLVCRRSSIVLWKRNQRIASKTWTTFVTNCAKFCRNWIAVRLISKALHPSLLDMFRAEIQFLELFVGSNQSQELNSQT